MSKKKTPPAYGESSGPMIVACQWNISSPTGPAEQFAGGSFPKSTNSVGSQNEWNSVSKQTPEKDTVNSRGKYKYTDLDEWLWEAHWLYVPLLIRLRDIVCI